VRWAKESAGWRKAVELDPVMTDSLFNVLLAYSTDGVNPFRSGQYTLW